MKLRILELETIFALMMGLFSCKSDVNDSQTYKKFEWDRTTQNEEFRPINEGTEISLFAIDSNIISFAVPYLIGTEVGECLPTHNTPHIWSITLILAEGVDVKKLSPTITLASGSKMTSIHYYINGKLFSKRVDRTGVINVGALNFWHQVDFDVITSNGSKVTYMFLAVAIGDLLPYN